MSRIYYLLILFMLSAFAAFSQQNDCTLGLVLSADEGAIGETVDIEVRTRNFADILGLQYNHQWNPQRLRFVEIELNPALPFAATDFNQIPSYTVTGFTNFTWNDSSLSGLSLTENTLLYTIRFTVLSNEEALVETNGEQVSVEFVDADLLIAQSYYFAHGLVNGASATNSNVVSACVLAQGCDENALGQIALQTTADENTYSYNWAGPNGFASSASSITSIQAGNYSLSLTNADAEVQYIDFYAVASNGPDFDLELSIDHDECGNNADGRAEFIAAHLDDFNFIWSTGDEEVPMLENLAAGDYSVTVLEWNTGCVAVYDFTIENTFPIWTNTQLTAASCLAADGTINVSVDVASEHLPLSFLWSTGETTEDLAGLLAGHYELTITSVNGCSKIISVVLPQAQAVNLTPVITAANCDGVATGAASFDVDETLYSFEWSNGNTGATASLPQGDHSVTITEVATGCTAEQAIYIPGQALDFVFHYTCLAVADFTSAEVTVIGVQQQNFPHTFEWSNGETTLVQSQSAAASMVFPVIGNHSVTVTNSIGCTETIEFGTIDCAGNHPDVSLNLSPNNASVSTGETLCLDVQADGFTDIIGSQFTLEWDENQLQFESVSNFGLPNLANSDFGFNLTDDGILTNAWLAQSQTTGVSLAAQEALYTVCWTVIGNTGETTINFTHSPTLIEITQLNNNVPTAIEVATQSAQISINGNSTADLTLNLASDEVLSGANFCLPVKVSQFNSVAGLQFSLNWDPTALQYTGTHHPLSLDLSEINFGTNEEAINNGDLRFLWTDPQTSGESLPNNTTLFDVCFTAIGAEGDYPVQFSSNPILIEAVDPNMNQISVATNNGTVTIGGVPSNTASLRIESVGAEPSETICVPVVTEVFEDIISMQFSITWDEELLSFENLEYGNALPGIDASNFNATAGQSFMAFAWIDALLEGVTLDPGATIFELCFTAGNQEGLASINFANTPTAIEFVQGANEISFIPMNGQIDISLDGFVWPGDTNADELANNFDLLNIGLNYGFEGPERISQSIEWLPLSAQSWLWNTPESNVNYKHADVNGDGIINSLDTLGLAQNWGLEADGFIAQGNTSNATHVTGPPIFVLPDTISAGATARLPIILGTEDTPVESAYGLAFTIEYDPTMIVPGSVSLDFEGWMGTQGDEMLAMYRDFPGHGQTEVALVRTDGINFSGNGAVGNFTIIMEDVIFRNNIDVEVLINISNVRLIDYAEIETPTTPRQTTTLVLNVVDTDEPAHLRNVTISPVPAQDFVTITAPDLTILNTQVFNALGQLIELQENSNKRINISQLPQGAYWLKVLTDRGLVNRQFIKQ